MKRTVRELAALCGVSPSTVSRVLSGRQNVNPETRRRVEAALGGLVPLPGPYRRKRSTDGTVLIIAGETASNFHTQLFETMSSKLRNRGYIVLVGHTEYSEELEEQYVELAQRQGYGGIIMITPVETERLKRLVAESPCPIVLVNRYLRSLDLDAVYMDNYRAGYMVASHLVEFGHRRVVCMSGERKWVSCADRINGFNDAFDDAGLAAGDYLLWEGDLSRECGRRFGGMYLERFRDYTAVFCFSESMARGFVETVAEAGLSIPDDVGVVCVAPAPVSVDDKIGLTCVIHDASQLADAAADILLDRLGGMDAPPRKIVFPPRLCVQDSVKRLGGGTGDPARS